MSRSSYVKMTMMDKMIIMPFSFKPSNMLPKELPINMNENSDDEEPGEGQANNP